MPTTQPSPKSPLIPAGEHYLTLVAVEVKEVDNLKFLKGDHTAKPKVDKWLWRFVSDDVDPEQPDVHYEMPVWTFANYGHAKANLTKLLDQIVPKATPEQKANLNTDAILGRRFKAMVVHKQNDKGDPIPDAFMVPLKPGDAGFEPPQPIARPEEIPV